MPRSARPLRFAALALAAVALGGCRPYVEGNCVNGSEARPLTTAFQGVRVQTGFQATVTAGAAQPRLVVSGDANLLRYIHAEVVPDPGSVPANVLRLWIQVPDDGQYSLCIPPVATLEMGELSFVGAEDDSHVDASGVATQILAVEASGKSDVSVAGPGGGRIQVVADDGFVHAASYPVTDGAQADLTNGARAELHSDGPVVGSVASGCTLANLGTGTCAGVVASGTPPPTITCPVQ